MVSEFVWLIKMPFMDEYSIILSFKMKNKVPLVHTLMNSVARNHNKHQFLWGKLLHKVLFQLVLSFSGNN
jgi:hypothetical protein